MAGTVEQWDVSAFLWINGHNTPFLDQLMLFSSNKLTWIPFYLFILYLVFKEKSSRGFVVLLFVAATIALSDQTSVHAFKFVFHRLRPCHDPTLEGLVRTIENHCGGSYGFISSHAANSFALIGFLLLTLRRTSPGFRAVLWIWGFLVLYSRVYLGVHFPSDVLTGAVVGLALGFSMGKLYKITEQHFLQNNGEIKNQTLK